MSTWVVTESYSRFVALQRRGCPSPLRAQSIGLSRLQNTIPARHRNAVLSCKAPAIERQHKTSDMQLLSVCVSKMWKAVYGHHLADVGEPSTDPRFARSLRDSQPPSVWVGERAEDLFNNSEGWPPESCFSSNCPSIMSVWRRLMLSLRFCLKLNEPTT